LIQKPSNGGWIKYILKSLNLPGNYIVDQNWVVFYAAFLSSENNLFCALKEENMQCYQN